MCNGLLCGHSGVFPQDRVPGRSSSLSCFSSFTCQDLSFMSGMEGEGLCHCGGQFDSPIPSGHRG